MNTLVSPVITEKSMTLAAQGVFTFLVVRSATKHSVKQAVEKLFGVQVTGINMSVIHTADRGTGRRRIQVSAPSKKYARVSLKAGQTIDLFDLKEDK